MRDNPLGANFTRRPEVPVTTRSQASRRIRPDIDRSSGAVSRIPRLLILLLIDAFAAWFVWMLWAQGSLVLAGAISLVVLLVNVVLLRRSG